MNTNYQRKKTLKKCLELIDRWEQNKENIESSGHKELDEEIFKHKRSI